MAGSGAQHAASRDDETSHLLLDHAGAHVVLDQSPDVIHVAHELGGALDRERARARELDDDALACSAGPTRPAISRPMMALENTVRQGKRLSVWNTKPRSPPGLRTARPSSSTSPEVACSSPATMRRNVVLPQPEGPTTEMNCPRSI